ncbi:MAG: tetratricopeptide repeat protein [Candidatus Omnitrophota bacterium]
MKKILILLCLGLIGCVTVSKENNLALLQNTEKPKVAIETKSVTNIRHVSIDQKELDSIISIFSEALKNNPNHAGIYYNRAVAYFYKNNYEKSREDVRKAESLGFKFNDNFLKSLNKASGKEK